MKQFLLLLLLCLTQGIAAQTILDDAKTLSDCFTDATASTADRASLKRGLTIDENKGLIFSKYIPTGTVLSYGVLVEAFKGNPFIRVEETDQNQMTINGSFNANSTSGSSQSSGASGFTVSNLADGLARFLVKRTKQELSRVFFDDFKKKVEKDSFLRNFCPFTQTQLALIDSKVYQFNDYLETLREGFTADMTALPSSTERFLRSPDLCEDCADKVEGKVMIDFLHIAQQMVNGEPPIDMMAYLAQPGSSAIQSAQPTDTLLYNMAAGLRFLNLVSESLRNPASSDTLLMPWHSASEIRIAFQDPKLLRIYLGLLWQKAEGIDFVIPKGTKTPMRTLMIRANTGMNLVESWRKSIESLGKLTQSLQFSLRSSASTPTTVADDFFTYSQSVTDLLLAINQTGRMMLNFKDKDIIPVKYVLLMRQSNALYFNVRQRNFAGAFGNVIYCLNLLKDGNEKDKKAIAEMLRYANFMAAIAEANSPEEMERAIEFFALPPGSSQSKKHPGRFSVALNAYTGFAWGREYLGNDESSKKISALTAPIGFSGSIGLGKAGSIGAFVPLIDIGAVTAYRFDDDNAGDLPELTWNNILSPGLYVVYDAPGKWPFAFGYGAQIGPSLRKVTETKGGTEVEISKSGWRRGFFLTVDIPITFFYLGKGK
jgi:hypothetical protein